MGTSIPYGKFVLKLGDGATPEAFTKPCGMTSRSFNRSANMKETVRPDCNDEDAAAVVERAVVSKDWQIQGAFIIEAEDYDTWDDWCQDDDHGVRNVQVVIVEPAALAGRTYQGPAVLPQFNMTAEHGGKVQGDVTIAGAGKLTRVKVSA